MPSILFLFHLFGATTGYYSYSAHRGFGKDTLKANDRIAFIVARKSLVQKFAKEPPAKNGRTARAVELPAAALAKVNVTAMIGEADDGKKAPRSRESKVLALVRAVLKTPTIEDKTPTKGDKSPGKDTKQLINVRHRGGVPEHVGLNVYQRRVSVEISLDLADEGSLSWTPQSESDNNEWNPHEDVELSTFNFVEDSPWSVDPMAVSGVNPDGSARGVYWDIHRDDDDAVFRLFWAPEQIQPSTPKEGRGRLPPLPSPREAFEQLFSKVVHTQVKILILKAPHNPNEKNPLNSAKNDADASSRDVLLQGDFLVLRDKDEEQNKHGNLGNFVPAIEKVITALNDCADT